MTNGTGSGASEFPYWDNYRGPFLRDELDGDSSLSGLAWDCLGPLGALFGGMMKKPSNNFEDYWRNLNEIKKSIWSAPININPVQAGPQYPGKQPEKAVESKKGGAYKPTEGKYPMKIADDGHGHIVYIDFGDIGCNNGIGNVRGRGNADISIGNNYRGARIDASKRASSKSNTLDDIHSAAPMYW